MSIRSQPTRSRSSHSPRLESQQTHRWWRLSGRRLTEWMLSSALSRRALSSHTCQMHSAQIGHGRSPRSSQSYSMALLSGEPLGTDLLWIGASSGISLSRLYSFEAGVVVVAEVTSPSLCASVTGVLAGAISSSACGSTIGGGQQSTVVYALSPRHPTPPSRSSESLSTSMTASFRERCAFSTRLASPRSMRACLPSYGLSTRHEVSRCQQPSRESSRAIASTSPSTFAGSVVRPVRAPMGAVTSTAPPSLLSSTTPRRLRSCVALTSSPLCWRTLTCRGGSTSLGVSHAFAHCVRPPATASMMPPMPSQWWSPRFSLRGGWRSRLCQFSTSRAIWRLSLQSPAAAALAGALTPSPSTAGAPWAIRSPSVPRLAGRDRLDASLVRLVVTETTPVQHMPCSSVPAGSMPHEPMPRSMISKSRSAVSSLRPSRSATPSFVASRDSWLPALTFSSRALEPAVMQLAMAQSFASRSSCALVLSRQRRPQRPRGRWQQLSLLPLPESSQREPRLRRLHRAPHPMFVQ